MGKTSRQSKLSRLGLKQPPPYQLCYMDRIDTRPILSIPDISSLDVQVLGLEEVGHVLRPGVGVLCSVSVRRVYELSED